MAADLLTDVALLASTVQPAAAEPGGAGYLSWIALGLAALLGGFGTGALVRRRRRRRDAAQAAAATGNEDSATTNGAPKRGGKRVKEGRELWAYTLPKVLPYAKPYWKFSAGSIGTTVVAAVVAIAQPWPIALVFDEVLQSEDGGSGFLGGLADALVGDGRYWVLGFALACLFSLTLIEGSVTLLGTYIETRLKLGMVLDFMTDLFEHFQRLGLTFHNKSFKGALMNRINQAPSGLGEFVASAGPIVQSGLTLLGMLVVAAIVDWQVAAASLLIVPLLYYQISLYSSRVIPQLRKTGQLEMRVMSVTLEAMQMLRLIVSFGREQHAQERFREEALVANEARMKVTLRQTLFSLTVSVATALGTALVLGLGALHVMQGKISTGELVVLMTYIAAVYQPLSTLTTTVSTLNEQLVTLGFALEVLEQEPEVVEAPDAKEIERVQGRVTFEGVSFTYKGRKKTLDDIAFEVEPGERVAIVGQTGSGKSTLASLMIRFYDPDEGRVLVDGSDIRDLTLRSLREQMAVVLQEPLLLSGTIGDNICYGRLEATEEEIVEAAKAANVHDFISQLKQGYDTELGERGAELSGGEQQRICVARAFLKDAPILILDEPTSSIDAKTEKVIFDALEDLMVGRTSFVITHRLSTIRDASRIMVMANGRIVAEGTHDELFESSELYRSLYGKRVVRAHPPSRNGKGHRNGLPPLEVERLRARTRLQPAPTDLFRSSLIDELELQIPFRELLTHWDLSSASAAERTILEEELARAAIDFEPSLLGLRDDDLITLRLRSHAASPIAAALDDGWKAVRARLGGSMPDVRDRR